MTACVACNKEIGFLDRLSYNKDTGRCGQFQKVHRQKLDHFRQGFLWTCRDGILTDEEWSSPRTGALRDGVRMDDALAHIRGDALHFIERTLAFAAADGVVSDDEERAVFHPRQILGFPQVMAQPVLDRLAYLRHVAQIWAGQLRRLEAHARLESAELCHLETPAMYHKVNAKSITRLPGKLLATSAKLRFLSPAGREEISWKNVMRAETQQGDLYLELSVKRGNGFYAVPDPLVAQATCDAFARMGKRQILAPLIAEENRHIPHNVKRAVWQRDGGRCVQCGPVSYLEFAHVIPHSKGGANTLTNVQRLCRGCNLAKGDRI